MARILIVSAVIVGTAIVEMLTDSALKVDLSHLSLSQRIIHNVVYKMSGGVIAATVWFA